MMKNKVSYIVNPILTGVCAGVVLLCVTVGGIRAYKSDWVAAVIFFLVAALYFVVGINYASFVTVDASGVTLKFLGIRRRSMSWDEVAESGIAGSKIFNEGNKKKVGTLYIYFSPDRMDDMGRFNMMLHFPPKDKIYLHYTVERLQGIRWFYDKKLTYYNIGDLEV